MLVPRTVGSIRAPVPELAGSMNIPVPVKQVETMQGSPQSAQLSDKRHICTIEGRTVQAHLQTSIANHDVTGNLLSESIRAPVPEISKSTRAPVPVNQAAIPQVSSHSAQGTKPEDPNRANQDAHLANHDTTRVSVPEHRAASLQVSFHSATGMKPGDPNRANQDAHLEIKISESKQLLGVFDGHGLVGEKVSNMVKDVFAELANAIASSSDIQGAFQQAFREARNRVMQANIGDESGTTAMVALVDSAQKSASIAYAGDSAAIIIDPRGNIVFQSEDHRPSNEKEVQRLRACGGQVMSGRLLLDPGRSTINVGFSRAIGSFRFAHQGLSAEPDVFLAMPFEAGSSLILASDGVWDVLPKEVVANMLAQVPDSAQYIVGQARSNWKQTQTHIDDITAVVAKCA
jgi:serine/threonine protein phosphatase PrpC